MSQHDAAVPHRWVTLFYFLLRYTHFCSIFLDGMHLSIVIAICQPIYLFIYLSIFASHTPHNLSVSQTPSMILLLVSTYTHAHARSLSPSFPLPLPPHTLTRPPLHTIPVSLEHVPLNRRYHEKRAVTGAEWWMRHHLQWLRSSALLVPLYAPAMLCCILLPDDDVIFLNRND